MTYYVQTPEMGVSILSDGVGQSFSVRPAADDDLLFLHVLAKFFQYRKHPCEHLHQ